MLGKIGISVTIVAALVLGAVRLPAATCILSNAPSEKACTMGCCANKSCCKTSHQRTGLPAQSLAKASSDQQNIATLPAIVTAMVSSGPVKDLFVFSSAECGKHSPPPLALSCIRLI